MAVWRRAYAGHVARETGLAIEAVELQEEPLKDLAAVALGKRRLKALSNERRREIASMGGKARQQKRREAKG